MTLSPESIRRGSILWLINPFKNLEPEDSDDELLDLPDTFNGIKTGLLGHPVMVLHKLDGTTDVAVCLLTTLRGRDLEDRQRTYQYQYNHEFYLAIHPLEPPCPYLYPQLRLEHDLQLRKPGYLSIRERYTIPLNMLEHYNRGRPELRYRLTAKSFTIVAKTFAMKVSRPIKSRRENDSSTQSLCDVPPKPTTEVTKPAMTHSEPDLGSEGSPLAKIKPSAMPQSEPERATKKTPTSYVLANSPSTCMQSIQENDATRMEPSLTSGGFKARVSAGSTYVFLKILVKSREFMDAFRTCFHQSEA